MKNLYLLATLIVVLTKTLGVEHRHSEVLENFPNKVIVGDAVSDGDEFSDTGSISSASVYNDLREKIEGISFAESTGKSYILDYSFTALIDITFKELTDRLVPLLPLTAVGCFVVDLSYNGLTIDSVRSLKKWLEHPAVEYINIDGNPRISKRYIKGVCHALREGGLSAEDVQKLLAKVVFLPGCYIYTANKRVKVYKNLCKEGVLPEDWASIHLEYYRLVSNQSNLSLSTDLWIDVSDEGGSESD